MRPLHPALPGAWASKAIRVTMSDADWGRFEALACALAVAAPTQARAYGLALTVLMDTANLPAAEDGPPHWMDWELRKTLRLLSRGR